MSAPPADHGGWVTAFITMSGSKDEIDWELVGKRSDQALTNVFYRGIPEFNMHDTVENMPFNSSVHLVHDYTIDWKPSGIIWSIDGTPVRTYLKGDSWENTTMCPGCWWFPDTPSVVSMSIWDGSLISGEWAGKNVTFGGGDGLSMRVYSLDVQCYNASGYPVDAQPPLQLQQRPQPQSPDSSASVVANSLADNFRAMIGVVVAIVVIVCSM
jgi:beta-glucanase (GH16 family)